MLGSHFWGWTLFRKKLNTRSGLQWVLVGAGSDPQSSTEWVVAQPAPPGPLDPNRRRHQHLLHGLKRAVVVLDLSKQVTGGCLGTFWVQDFPEDAVVNMSTSVKLQRRLQ